MCIFAYADPNVKGRGKEMKASFQELETASEKHPKRHIYRTTVDIFLLKIH